MSKESPDWNDPEVRDAWTLIGLYNLQPGDEHPVKKGWFLTDKLGKRKEPLWYKPPSKFSVWSRRVAFVLYALLICMGIVGVIVTSR